MKTLFFVSIILLLNKVSYKNAISDLNGLSELPLAKLLQVKNSLEQEDSNGFDERNFYEDSIGAKLDISQAQASALHGKFKKPLSRGHHEMWQKKGQKKGLSTIFQMTITALAFLAFAGYLLCLLVQAIKAKQTSTATGTGSGAVVFASPNRRRPIIIRQKRDLIWPEADPEDLYFALRQFSEGFTHYHTIDYKYYNNTINN